MLKSPLPLNRIDATQLFEYLYSFFRRDFVDNKTYLNQSIYIDPRSHRLDEGKELDFWHLITRNEKLTVKEGNRYVQKTERYPDFRRAERIEWVKLIIDNYTDPAIKLFYHQETNQKRDIRLYLWAYENDFVVILQKLGKSSSFLVTSFHIDHDGKKLDYERRYQLYESKQQAELRGCEWF